MRKLLEKGDIIELKAGHKVYGDVSLAAPWLKPYYKSSPYEIEIGRTYEHGVPLEPGDDGYDPDYVEKKYREMSRPDYVGFKGAVGSPCKTIDRHPTGHLIGKYVVLHATECGGGMQCGPNTPRGESFPDGHKVVVKGIAADGSITGPEVSFYQTGCFTCMIQDVEAVGHVELGYHPIQAS